LAGEVAHEYPESCVDGDPEGQLLLSELRQTNRATTVPSKLGTRREEGSDVRAD
jgi:hypothetical protein